ncbi:MAG: hypothetical protein F4Y49_00650 [Dehalococcoidia bacterium]|nr:hypothetical protein [Dehalococcoidia bacterium]
MNAQTIDLNLRLPFEAAGVEFDISVGESSADAGASFSLSALDSSGAPIPFTSDVSPVLADWVRGYTRWLYRAGVTARYTETAISGSFGQGMSAEQVLEGVQLACDMVRQRFELYEDSIKAR